MVVELLCYTMFKTLLLSFSWHQRFIKKTEVFKSQLFFKYPSFLFLTSKNIAKKEHVKYTLKYTVNLFYDWTWGGYIHSSKVTIYLQAYKYICSSITCSNVLPVNLIVAILSGHFQSMKFSSFHIFLKKEKREPLRRKQVTFSAIISSSYSHRTFFIVLYTITSRINTQFKYVFETFPSIYYSPY